MATYCYNRYSGESNLSQWSRHIQNQSYIEDITKSVKDNTKQQTRDYSGIISRQTSEFNEAIHSASRDQILAIQESTNAICGSLDSGFELLTDNLQDISYNIDGLRSEVNSMASMLDWKLSLLIERQRITNLLLGNIAVLLRIPDIQKERQYYIEQGLKFLKNAIFDNDFYDDSLNNFLKAEKIEPTDFFVLHRIGLIYMYSPKHLELNRAEEYFKKAAKYAVAETNDGATITTNYLNKDLNRNIEEQKPTIDSIKIQAAESYMFTGRSCYIQGKLTEAADYASKGYGLFPQMVEAGFTQAKALAANNNDVKAAIVLEKVINTDRFYSLKTLSDLDLCPKPSIQSLLKKLQRETTDKATGLLQHCLEQKIIGSNGTDYLKKIERLINLNTYLTSKKAIDLFEKNKIWKFCEPYKNEKQSAYLKKLVLIIEAFCKIEFYKNPDNNFIKVDANFIVPILNVINKETQWTFPLYDTIIKVPDWTKSIISKENNCNVIQFIELEKKLNDDLPSVLLKLTNIIQNASDENTGYISKLENERRSNNFYNLLESIGWGTIAAVAGAVVGWVAGAILALIFEFGSCVAHISEKGYKTDSNSSTIMIITIVIGSLIGYISSFKSKRKYYPQLYVLRNSFVEKMSQCSDSELRVIIEQRSSYQKEAVDAAEFEAKKRNIL